MTPAHLWKSFVDTFANLHDGVHHLWVAERGAYPGTDQNKEVNALLRELTAEQRRVIAHMLVEARYGGVHDALVVLNDRMAMNKAAYIENGVQMEFQPFGSTLYQDFVGRKEGEEWPD